MSVAILDLDSISFVCGCDRIQRDDNGEPIKGEDGKSIYVPKSQEQIIEDTDKVMHDILSSCNAESYIGFIKGAPGIKTFRHQLNPEYKANRSSEEPEWWPIVKNYLVERWQAIPVYDFEVDDYVNVTRLLVPDSFIVAIDKDLLEQEGTHFNWKKKEWITVEPYQAKYWFWRDMITGQPGDNIKGIPGKGKRFVEKLFDMRESESFRGLVLDTYCEHFGERHGIGFFTMNYGCLKLLDEPDDLAESFDEDGDPINPFIIPTSIPYNKIAI